MSFFSGLANIAIPAAATYFGGPWAGAAASAAVAGRPKSGKNPAQSGMPYLNQLQGLGEQTYNPYIQRGQRQDQGLEQQYGQMMNDPGAFLNSLQQGYQPSQGYQFQQGELNRGMGNNAAAGGFRGTQGDQQEQARYTQGLLSQDMQNYLSQVLGIHGSGLQGAQGQSDRGFNAATGRADYLGNALGAQAGLAFHGQRQQNQNRQDGRNAWMNALTSAGGNFLGQSGKGGAFADGGAFAPGGQFHHGGW